MGMDWHGARVLAFAGIADPSRFFATLRAEGAEVVRGEALGDHETLSETLLRRLEAEAAAAGAQLVTTEKDAARLPPQWRCEGADAGRAAEGRGLVGDGRRAGEGRSLKFFAEKF
jgi:tetraacyldisaccharide-1-P 4'-kinase